LILLRIPKYEQLTLNGAVVVTFAINRRITTTTTSTEVVVTGAMTGAELDSVDALSFETLIPKNIVERYVSLLVEHRRLILCGPTGTGKTYLASRLARHLVRRLVTSDT